MRKFRFLMLEALKSAPHLNDNYNKIGTVFKFLLHLRSSKFLCSLVSSIAHRRAPVLSPPFMSLLLFNVYGLHLIHKFLIMDRKQCPRCNAWYSLSRGLKIHMGYCSKIDVSKHKSTDNNSDYSRSINIHSYQLIHISFGQISMHTTTMCTQQLQILKDATIMTSTPQMLVTQMMITFSHLVLIYQL